MVVWLPNYCSSEIFVHHVAPQTNSSLQSQEQVYNPRVAMIPFSP